MFLDRQRFAKHWGKDNLILAKAVCFSIARRARYLWSSWYRVHGRCIGSSCFLFIMPTCLPGLYCTGGGKCAALEIAIDDTQTHPPRASVFCFYAFIHKVDRKPRIVWQRPSYLVARFPIILYKSENFRVDTNVVHRTYECKINSLSTSGEHLKIP